MRFRLVLALSVVAFIFALPAQSKVITVTCTLTVNPKSGQPPLMVNANGSCTENGIPPAVFGQTLLFREFSDNSRCQE